MRSPFRLLVLTAAILIGVASAPASAAGSASAYTKHDFEKCAALKSPHLDVVDKRACEGYGGIKVLWTGEPDSSSLDFGKTGDDDTLGIGTAFEARSTIEWRGPQAAGKIKPLAAIVRYDTGASVSRLNVPRLVVYRVAPGTPSCVMAIVKGGNAKETARSIVDRHAAGFVCGKSKRIVR